MADWSPEEDAILRKAITDGLSGGQAAGLLPGRSRNSAIGRAYRLGLHFNGAIELAPKRRAFLVEQCKANTAARVAKAATPKPPKPSKTAPGFRFGPGYSDTIKAPLVMPQDAFAPLDGLTHRPWTARVPGECSWPLDVDGEVHSCCRPMVRGSYCATHAAFAYQSGPAISKKEVEWTAKRYAA